MRKYVKTWVTQLDSFRFYPGEECELEVTPWKSSSFEEEPVQESDSRRLDHPSGQAVTPEAALFENHEFVASEIPVEPDSSTKYIQ